MREPLQKLVESCGAVAGVVMGPEDVTESVCPDGHSLDIDAIGTEFSFVLGQVRRAADILEIGALEEVTVSSQELTFLIRILNEDYFLGLAMSSDGNLGRGRYLMRMAQGDLQATLD
jgi:predicted regulator of Ras-like GTPase activity (Roadblock/LC7/MglB family)